MMICDTTQFGTEPLLVGINSLETDFHLNVCSDPAEHYKQPQGIC